MLRKALLPVLGVIVITTGVLLFVVATDQSELSVAAQTEMPARPSAGYDIHVLAPHLVDGHQMGPYHHYCKVIGEGPQIQCLIYDNTDANSPLTQVEWIYAKSMTRESVPLKAWNKNWHDHAVEIAGGRVQVLDMPADKAKEVADLVSTTDGMIYHFYYDGKLPNGKMSIAQAVGHKNLTAAELKNYGKK
jgi:hypothetical protein